MLARDSIVYFIIIFGLCAPALGVVGTNLNCSLFLSMPFNGYNCTYWQQCYDRGLDVSEHSMYIYLPNVGLTHLFSPTMCTSSIAVPSFCFVICVFWSNLITQGWTHDDEYPWTCHGGSRIYSAFTNSAICYPDQCRLRGRRKNGKRGIDYFDTCLRAVLTKHCYWRSTSKSAETKCLEVYAKERIQVTV